MTVRYDLPILEPSPLGTCLQSFSGGKMHVMKSEIEHGEEASYAINLKSHVRYE